MAFITIPPSIIQVSKAIKKEIFQLIKDNLDDHETRINSLETTATKIEVMKFLLLNGSVFPTATGLYYYEADQEFTITDSFIRIFEVNSLTGIIEIDIKKSVTDLDNASFSSIFTTKPSIDLSTASDYDSSINQVFDPSKVTMQPGQFLRLDITSAPTNGVLPKLLINLFGE